MAFILPDVLTGDWQWRGSVINCLGGLRPGLGELARPSSGAVSASPRVTVSSPSLPPNRARGGHALASGAFDP